MIRNLDQLELSIKALSLHKGDVLVVRVENNPTIAEMQNIQQGIANLFSNLELAEPIAYVVLPRTLDLSQLDEDGMRTSGWIRAWQPIHASQSPIDSIKSQRTVLTRANT